MSYIENTIAVLCGGAAGAVCRFKLNAAIMSGLTMASLSASSASTCSAVFSWACCKEP